MRAGRAIFALLLVALLASATSARARPRPQPRSDVSFEANKRLGLGVSLGAPFAVRAHLYLGRDTALEAAVGTYYRLHLHPLGQGGFHTHLVIMTYPGVITRQRNFWLPFYVGVGLRYMDHGQWEHRHVGLRFPFGVVLDFNCAPFDLFVESAITLDFTTLDESRYHGMTEFSGSVGGRFYFW